MSQWVNKYAVMRDLSLAQGGRVVGELEGTIFHGDRPPSQNITEETEEEFYRNCIGDGDFGTPDLGLIKHMLDVVRDQDIPSDEDKADSKILEISKLNPLSADYYPSSLTTVTNNISPKTQPKVKKMGRNRNVAMESLLQKFENDEINTKNNNEINLLTPENFTENISDGVKKVCGWFESQEKNCYVTKKKKENVSLYLNPSLSKKMTSYNPLDFIPPKEHVKKETLKLELNPASMFKRKLVSSTPEPKTIKEQPVQIKTPTQTTEYVPSALANEYYKKFLESSKMKNMLHEDVWTKAERQMKEIDERRKKEAELFAVSMALAKLQSPSSVGSSGGLEDKRLDVVRLPQHRHLMSDECKVCAIRDRETSESDNKNTSNSSTDVDSWRAQGEENATDDWRINTQNDDDNSKSWRKQMDLKLNSDSE